MQGRAGLQQLNVWCGMGSVLICAQDGTNLLQGLKRFKKSMCGPQLQFGCLQASCLAAIGDMPVWGRSQLLRLHTKRSRHADHNTCTARRVEVERYLRASGELRARIGGSSGGTHSIALRLFGTLLRRGCRLPQPLVVLRHRRHSHHLALLSTHLPSVGSVCCSDDRCQSPADSVKLRGLQPGRRCFGSKSGR